MQRILLTDQQLEVLQALLDTCGGFDSAIQAMMKAATKHIPEPTEEQENAAVEMINEMFEAVANPTDIEDIDAYVGMALTKDEHSDAEAVFENCLLAVAETHEAAFDLIGTAIESLSQTIDEYHIVIRRDK